LEGIPIQPLILASASPRRLEICALAGIPVEVHPASLEWPLPTDRPLPEGVLWVARQKAEEVFAQFPDRVVIGSDTVVALEDEVLGKPKNEADAFRMLQQLQGKTHTVYTAVWVASPQGADGFTDQTLVTFFSLTEQEIAAYIRSGEPMDKAGSYGIQGAGMRFVKEIHGDYYTVMGLPGGKLRRFLQQPPFCLTLP